MKLSKKSELLVKGNCLMKGYWKDPKATKEALKEGWLHTGDLANIHNDGFIEITGRVKEIIVNSGGDNISPSRVESMLCFQPEIEAAVVVGDKRPWLCGIINTNDEFNSQFESKEEKQKHISEIIDIVNKSLSQAEKIRKFILAEEPFTVANKMLTPTLKVRRSEVYNKYKKQIDKLYN